MFDNRIRQFVEVFGFSESEKEQIIRDLNRLIAERVLVYLNDYHPRHEDLIVLRKVMDKLEPDYEGISEEIAGILANPKFRSEIQEIIKDELSSWLQAVDMALTEAQRTKKDAALSLIEY
jgi:hypothetical protein